MSFRLTASPGLSICKRGSAGSPDAGRLGSDLGREGTQGAATTFLPRTVLPRHRQRPLPGPQAESHRGRPPSRVPRRVSRAGLPGSRRFPGPPPTGSRRTSASSGLLCGPLPSVLSPAPLRPSGRKRRRSWALATQGRRRCHLVARRWLRAGAPRLGGWDRKGFARRGPAVIPAGPRRPGISEKVQATLPPAPLRLLPQSGEDQLGNPSQGLG